MGTLDKASELRIFLSTGEVSGDLIGARLARALRAADSGVSIAGTGGPRMEAEGVRVLHPTNRLGSVGLWEPVAAIPGLIRILRKLHAYIVAERPHACVLIGMDFFHALLGRWLTRQQMACIGYFPPQVWLWGSVASPIARSYDRILTSFLEEQQVYERAGGRAEFVGHYLQDEVGPVTAADRRAAQEALGFAAPHRVVGIFPGSRTHEIRAVAEPLLGAAQRMLRKDPTIRFVIPIADRFLEDDIGNRVRRHGLEGSVRIGTDGRAALAACDLAILCSGTVTLEAALMGVPMLILYRTTALTALAVEFLDATGLIASKTLGLPNLLLGERVVPERIQRQVNPVAVAEEAWSLLEDPGRRARMSERLGDVRKQLGAPGAIRRAARHILDAAENARVRRGPPIPPPGTR